jgi:hypothetical protein
MSVILFLVMALLGAGSASAATLTASSVSDVKPGDASVEVSISLANETANAVVGGIQMDVEFDPSALEIASVKAGEAAAQANKTVSSNPLSDGVRRVIVAGLNQNAISDGIVVILSFNIKATAAAGAYPVLLTELQLVNPDGVQLSGDTVAGSITVAENSEGEGEGGEGEGEGSSGNSGCFRGSIGSTGGPASPDMGILITAGAFMLLAHGYKQTRSRKQASGVA